MIPHTFQTGLLIAALLWPVMLLCAWLLRPLRPLVLAASATLALPALALALLADAGLQLRAPALFTSMLLGVDAVGRPFLLLTALLWFIAGIHSVAYMRHDERRASYTALLLATGTGNIGLTLAHDMLSFYLFFALMTFASYGLVVHSRTKDALRAGRVYILMALFGEALLLASLFTLMAHVPDAAFHQVPQAWLQLAQPGTLAVLVILGFGVKAGLLPVHLWLPLAHPVAPTPASALLSGAMIKAGVLGWLRFLPVGELQLPLPGNALMVAGVLATVYAAALGVAQRDAKTVLAYSSVSQMGFMATGVGAMLLVPGAAPLLILATAVYALHHGLAKGALFLAVGLLPPQQRRAWPWLLAAALPALALAGAPLTSGAMAKSALKSALGDLPGPWTGRTDLILTIAAVGTTLLMARYLSVLVPRSGADRAHADASAPARGAASAAPAHGRTVGMVVPWLGLVLLSAAAALWLPYALAPLGELPLGTDPSYLAAALWPVALGAALGVLSALLARRYPRLTIGTVPAGDIVTLLEKGYRAGVRGAGALAAASPGPVLREGYARAAAGIAAAFERIDAAAGRLTEGPAVGVLLCAIVLALLFGFR